MGKSKATTITTRTLLVPGYSRVWTLMKVEAKQILSSLNKSERGIKNKFSSHRFFFYVPQTLD